MPARLDVLANPSLVHGDMQPVVTVKVYYTYYMYCFPLNNLLYLLCVCRYTGYTCRGQIVTLPSFVNVYPSNKTRNLPMVSLLPPGGWGPASHASDANTTSDHTFWISPSSSRSREALAQLSSRNGRARTRLRFLLRHRQWNPHQYMSCNLNIRKFMSSTPRLLSDLPAAVTVRA